MFKQAGPCMVKLGKVVFSEPKFAKGENDFDICVECTHVDDPAQVDWWRGEMSQNYGKGNFKSMTQTKITMKTLRACGFEGDDLTMLEDQFACCEPVPAMIKEREYDGKKYYDIQYIGSSGGGNAPKADATLSADAMQKRMAALVGEAPKEPAPAATTAAPAATTDDDEPNPFI